MGVYDLGLSSDDFWRLTFGQFSALCERRKIDLYQKRFDAGALYTLIFNMFSKDKKLSLDDYLGEAPTQKQARRIAKKQSKPSGETLLEAFKAIFPPDKQTDKQGQK